MQARIGQSLVLVGLLSASVALAKGGGGGQSSPPRRVTPPPPDGHVVAPSAVRAETQQELIFGGPVHYQNLSLVPVLTTRQGPFQKYTLLESGLEAKTLDVREIGADGARRVMRHYHGRYIQQAASYDGDAAQVNAVEVRNTGNYPVYLLGGEMILGGKQDRIIQSDAIVPNTSKWTRVAVFCVEHGRWSGQNMKFAAGKALAHVALRQAALTGEQSKVWAEVSAKNRQQGTSNATDTYRRTIQNENVRTKIAPYREHIVKLLPADKRLAGMIFAINGKIRVADLFGNPVLFGDVRDKLLSAYILEALGQQVDRGAAPISAKAAKGFIDAGRKAKRMAAPSSGRSKNYKFEDKQLVGGETTDNGAKVRETYMSK